MLIDEIIKKARLKPRKIVFTEGSDERVVKAVSLIKKEKVAIPILLKDKLSKALEKARIMLENNEADAIITGATHSTVDTIRLALKFKKGFISSCFLILVKNKVYIFADCAVNPNPTSEELAEIGKQTAETAKLVGINAKIAMLSYSTKGSAEGELVEKVRKATEILKKKGYNVEGEMQVDAALNKEIGKRKFSGSKVAGDANVLIFPDLNSGNIGYKLVQEFGNAIAIGPIFQNLFKPVNDLSRGCKVKDIYYLAAITSLQAK